MMNEHQTIRIESIKRVHGRATLTLSTGEVLPMPRAMLRERPYKSGMPFDRQAFDLFIKERSYPFALEKAVSQLASRARTEKEIVDCLKKNAYPEATIARVMARLHEAEYINDADFAAQWTAARASKGLGSRRIRMELRQKGVDQAEIDQALSEMGDDDMMDGAIKAARKASRGKELSSPADRQKVLAALARRGYDFSLARQAIQRLIETE
ncbi:MAG: regulatory protein RecX [Clostridia bacterium]|nr:regulatory protein RecX [Clostridia bacterium]